MRRKNLERAIVLGLLLSTSVYGSAWADKTYTISEFRNLGTEISVDENTTVEGTGKSIGGDEVENTIVGKVITVGDGVVLNLNNLSGRNPNIKGNGIINMTVDNAINGAGIHMTGDIDAKELHIDVSNASGVKGVHAYGDVTINANVVDIKGAYNGFFLDPEASSANESLPSYL